MSTVNITKARQNLFKLVADVNVGFNPITIVNNKGKNAVLISEDEWKSIEETLYLSSIPGFIDNVNSIRKKKIGIKPRRLILMKNGKKYTINS